MVQGRVSLCGMRNIICNSRSMEENPWVYFIWTVFPWCRCLTEFFFLHGFMQLIFANPILKDAIVVSWGFGGDSPVCTNMIGRLCLRICKSVIKFHIKVECLPGVGWVNVQKLSQASRELGPFLSSPCSLIPTHGPVWFCVSPSLLRQAKRLYFQLWFLRNAFCQATLPPLQTFFNNLVYRF